MSSAQNAVTRHHLAAQTLGLWLAHGQAAVAALGAALSAAPEQGSQALDPGPAGEHIDGTLQLALEVLRRSGEFTVALRRTCVAELLPQAVSAAAGRARSAAVLAPAVTAVQALLATCCRHRCTPNESNCKLPISCPPYSDICA